MFNISTRNVIGLGAGPGLRLWNTSVIALVSFAGGVAVVWAPDHTLGDQRAILRLHCPLHSGRAQSSMSQNTTFRTQPRHRLLDITNSPSLN
jgi:hypothetical protein